MNLDRQYGELNVIPWHEAQEEDRLAAEKKARLCLIFYRYGFELNGNLYGFRCKSLQDITGSSPVFIPQRENSGSKGWWINREWMSFTRAKSITTEINKTVDVTHMAWHIGINLEMGWDPSYHDVPSIEKAPVAPKQAINLKKWLKDAHAARRREFSVLGCSKK